MSKIVQFPGEFITEGDRERDRWVTVAFCATVLPANQRITRSSSCGRRWRSLRMFPTNGRLSTTQYPAYAVKLLRPSLGAKFDRTAPVIRMFCAAVIRDLSFWARAAVIPD